ncbi:MAG: hypothetical protein EBR82_68490 [Caulobacteraceae bacterium]|nr:hypothetical protein [Caulobacteraceae bacterium]
MLEHNIIVLPADITARAFLLTQKAKTQRNREGAQALYRRALGAQALYRRALTELQRRGEVAHWWEQEALS